MYKPINVYTYIEYMYIGRVGRLFLLRQSTRVNVMMRNLFIFADYLVSHLLLLTLFLYK